MYTSNPSRLWPKSIAVALALAAITFPRIPAQTPSPNPLQMLVDVRHLSGDPVPDLKRSSFEVTAQNQKLPLTLSTHSPLVTYLLIVWPRTHDPTRIHQLSQTLLDTVPRNFAGTRLAVLDNLGQQTAFASSRAALLAELTTPGPRRPSSVPAALHDLASRPGRRALFSWPDSPVTSTQADAVGALLYQIGGDPYQNFTYVPTGPVTSTAAVDAFPSIRTLHAEPDLRRAWHDLAVDSRGFYLLTVACPPHAASLQLKVKLSEDLQVTAISLAPGALPTPRLEIRP